MVFEDYSRKFREKALDAGYSEDNINYYLTYARTLIENDVPVIYNTAHLAALTGYNTKYIKRAVSHTPYFYRTFNVNKKNGKKRIINEPLPSLKEIQLWINENILSKIKYSKFAKAYIPKRNILDNVRYHKNKKFIYCLDLENFFPSISIETVELLFSKLGYSSNLSNLMAKLCCLNGRLSQGAPSSPALSNHILFSFDEIIGDFAVKYQLRYTRYADDLTFSFNNEFDVNIIRNKVLAELKNVPFSIFKLNEDKTHLLKQSDRQVVTGIVVNNIPQVPSKYRKEIRKEIFYIRKYGVINHMQRINEKKSNYLYHLLGKINYVLSINPDDSEMRSYRDSIKILIPNFK